MTHERPRVPGKKRLCREKKDIANFLWDVSDRGHTEHEKGMSERPSLRQDKE